ncbi:MAG TPA: hypothetical protein VL096_01170, partial [Pirellulaceae bacterium]|nr:hypothetical protein [Pirellulaceae bacterium]
MIKFSCPNGHILSTNDDRAGTSAKCPKCQAPVVVPMASEVPAAPPEPSPPAPPAGGDMIVFLCPNGHRLNGPAKLKGKAGQCPHCGAKFRIPEDEEEEEILDEFEEVEDEDEEQ